MIRNSLDSNNNSTIQLDWVFPFTRTLGGYIQYFNGYGESLIDYNYKQESIGIGVALSVWVAITLLITL
jgi:phospholipase A1